MSDNEASQAQSGTQDDPWDDPAMQERLTKVYGRALTTNWSIFGTPPDKDSVEAVGSRVRNDAQGWSNRMGRTSVVVFTVAAVLVAAVVIGPALLLMLGE